jgi:predicted DNA-binding transcriptional regulator AlpA
MQITEVAKVLGISRALAYDLARRDELPVPVIKLGSKRMVVSRRSIQQLLEGNDKPKEKGGIGNEV